MFRRLYFNTVTGAAIMTYSTDVPNYQKPSFDEDKKTYSHFDGVKDEVIGWLDFENGEFERDFLESAGFKMNLETNALEFSYPDPADPQVEQPFQPPLTDSMAKLEAENALLKEQQAQMNADFTAFMDYYFSGGTA